MAFFRGITIDVLFLPLAILSVVVVIATSARAFQTAKRLLPLRHGLKTFDKQHPWLIPHATYSLSWKSGLTERERYSTVVVYQQESTLWPVASSLDSSLWPNITIEDGMGREPFVNKDNRNNSPLPTSPIFSFSTTRSPSPTLPIVHDHITRVDQGVIIVATTILVLAFGSLLWAAGPGAERFFMAGGVCAAFSHGMTTPIDVVKTRKQVDTELQDKSLVKATLRIVRKEGPRSLLAGMGPTTVGYLIEGAIKFGIYELLKPLLSRVIGSQLLRYSVCGVVSGAFASGFLCPMEAVRIRMVADPNFAPNGWIEAGYRMLQYEGVLALWKGIVPMIYKQVPYTMAKNVSFDIFARLAYTLMHSYGIVVAGVTKAAIPFVSAVLASILSCISSQPGDMLMSLINAHEGTKRTNDFVKEIMQSERGLRGFFVGMKARFVHVGLIVTVQLMIYDYIKRLCGIAATGSI